MGWMVAPEVSHERRTLTPGVRLAIAASGALVLVITVWTLFDFGGDQATSNAGNIVQTVVAWLVAAVTGARIRSEREWSTRLGWLLLAVTYAAQGVGETVSVLGQSGLVGAFQAPVAWGMQPSDLAFIAGSTFSMPAVLFLAGWMLSASRLRLILDGGIVAGSMLLVSWLTTVHTLFEHGLPPVQSVYYALADVVTVVVVLFTMSHAGRLKPALLIVGSGLLCGTLGDILSAYLDALSAPHAVIDLINPVWLAAYLLVGVGALVGRGEGLVRTDVQVARWQLIVPFVPLMLAGLLALVEVIRHQGLDVVSLVLLLVVVGLALVRQLAATLELQTVMTRLRRVSAEREVLIEQAPVGICRLDPSGRIEAANETLGSMLGYGSDELLGRSLLELAPDADQAAGATAYEALHQGRVDRLAAEGRLTRRDGSSIYAKQLARAVRGGEGETESFISIVEDITDARRQTQRAASIQRHLLPSANLSLDGYEVAGACLPAQDVAGDFYDWNVTPDGMIDLTLGDVMGKGMGAALVMAILRTALRSAPPDLGPADRMRAAAAAMSLGLTEEGLFSTLFHARLDVRSGLLRYVDAGHGYCVIRRANGELADLPTRSLPVGVDAANSFAEGEIVVQPGDTLVVYTDGLVETDAGTVTPDQLEPDFAEVEHAGAIVDRLMGRVPPRPADDVTVVVLCRLVGSARSARSGGRQAAALPA